MKLPSPFYRRDRSALAVQSVTACLAGFLFGLPLSFFALLWGASSIVSVGLLCLFLLATTSTARAASPAPRFPNPMVVSATFFSTLWLWALGLDHFFIQAQIGPFSDLSLHPVTMLGNAVFGSALFAGLGACIGFTYLSARLSMARASGYADH